MKVAVFGAGVSGLVAAHELAVRGFEVHVYEKAAEAGGMSRTQFFYANGRRLPGEHGFRVFPSFYSHLEDTLTRTPDPARPGHSLLERLIPTRVQGVAFKDGLRPLYFPQTMPRSAETVLRGLMDTLDGMKLEPLDIYRFQLKMFQYITSSPERRMGVYEKQSWWDFVQGDRYAPRFQKYLNSVPRALVAMDAHQSDAHTQSSVLVHHLLDQFTTGGETDRVLDGPSTDAWLKPWITHLTALGVTFHLGHALEALTIAGGTLQAAQVRAGLALLPVVADYYVLALPIEVVRTLIAPAAAAADAMASGNDSLPKLLAYPLHQAHAWLSGMQFFLDQDAQLIRGHLFFPDAEWGLSCVSQAQFWGEDFKRDYGGDRYAGVLSVDVANFDALAEVELGGGATAQLRARDCTPEQFARTVWRQLREGLGGMGTEYELVVDERLELRAGGLPANMPDRYYIDQALHLTGDAATATNGTPMLINPPASFELRPGPVDGYGLHLGRRLVLAGNHMQTYMNLPTMESAAESARHAVNAILWDSGFGGDVCTLWPLEGAEPRDLGFFKDLDRELFGRGAPHFVEILDFDRVLATLLPSGHASRISSECQPCAPLDPFQGFFPLIRGGGPDGAGPAPRQPRSAAGRERRSSRPNPLADYLAAVRPLTPR